ncbi:MAG: DNA alkylation repair protein [Polyangiales bacterium]
MSQPFKDYFNPAAAREIAERIHAVHPDFKKRTFVRRASKGLDELEMMGRVGLFADTLRDTLPQAIPEALGVLVASLPEPFPFEAVPREEGALSSGFVLWPYGEYVRRYATEHFDEAMVAMEALTQRFTSEFAVRPFVSAEPVRVVECFMSLTDHPSEHVRRWCSEGLRPRLPWGEKLAHLCADPSPILPVLEALKDDPSLYVRRSVANTLGDISKDHPELAVKTAKRWKKGASPERQWVVRHSLRTLVKAGHPGALEVYGFAAPRSLDVDVSVSPKKIRAGESVELSLALTNRGKKNVALLVDFRIHYMNKSKDPKPKVFKWKELELAPGETIHLKKKRVIKAATIRPIFSGRHAVDVQINGKVFGDAGFHLSV